MRTRELSSVDNIHKWVRHKGWIQLLVTRPEKPHFSLLSFPPSPAVYTNPMNSYAIFILLGRRNHTSFFNRQYQPVGFPLTLFPAWRCVQMSNNIVCKISNKITSQPIRFDIKRTQAVICILQHMFQAAANCAGMQLKILEAPASKATLGKEGDMAFSFSR